MVLKLEEHGFPFGEPPVANQRLPKCVRGGLREASSHCPHVHKSHPGRSPLDNCEWDFVVGHSASWHPGFQAVLWLRKPRDRQEEEIVGLLFRQAKALVGDLISCSLRAAANRIKVQGNESELDADGGVA